MRCRRRTDLRSWGVHRHVGPRDTRRSGTRIYSIHTYIYVCMNACYIYIYIYIYIHKYMYIMHLCICMFFAPFIAKAKAMFRKQGALPKSVEKESMFVNKDMYRSTWETCAAIHPFLASGFKKTCCMLSTRSAVMFSGIIRTFATRIVPCSMCLTVRCTAHVLSTTF
jgi:hypothetical protein